MKNKAFDDDLGALAAAASTSAEARFRIMRQGPMRQAMKLEPFWWERLEAMALERRLSAAELVFRLLGALPDGANRTAYLRRCIGADLFANSRRYGAGAGAPLRELADGAPGPAFIVSNIRGLIAVNAPALRELERRLLQQVTLGPANVGFRRQASIDALFAALRAARGASIDHELRLRTGEASLNIACRATLFPAAERTGAGAADCAFCFLL